MSAPRPIPELGLTTIDLVELSDLAWTMVDPDGEHEQLEQAWVASLPRQWPPPADLVALRARLAEAVGALRTAGQAPVLEIVAAVVLHLASHPERQRAEPAVIGEALRAQFGDRMPAEIAAWLSERRAVEPRRRSHGARTPRRHLHSRPPRAPDAGA